MAEIGYATLGIIPSFDGFGRKLDQGTSRAMTAAGSSGGTTFGNAAGKTAGARFGSVFKTAAKAGLVGLGALGVGAFALAKDSISAASDLEESTNKVKQVFGEGADAVFKFSSKAADALGQTNQQARDAAATFGLFGNLAGKSDKQSAKFATRMTRLASDLASFHNTEPEEAVQALGAALRGEAEPIRSYGVLLDDATLKAEALRMGLLEPVKDQAKIKSYQIGVIEGQRALNDAIKEHGKASFEAEKAAASLGTKRELLQKATEGTIPALSQEQKVLAASSAIFKQTEVAQGDFARTSDGLANQQRRLSARFEDAKAKLGVGLLPIMTDAADFLLDKGIPAFEKFADWFNEKGVPALKDFADEARPIIKSALPAIKDGLETVKDVAEDAAPIIKGLFDGFNALPDDLKRMIVLAGGGVAAGKKLGFLGGGGTKGLLGGLVSQAKPMPVFVTNPGFGAGAGGVPVAGAPGGKTAPAPKSSKFSGARNLGRAVLPFALIDATYEVTLNDTYGLTPGAPDFDPIIKQGGGAFGAGLSRRGLGGKKFEDGSIWEPFIDNTAKAGRAVDVLGLRIGTAMNTAKGRVDSFDDKMTLVGSRKIRPQIDTSSIRAARNEVEGLVGALDHVANAATSGLDSAAQTVIDAVNGGTRHRSRRRNLGGMP